MDVVHVCNDWGPSSTCIISKCICKFFCVVSDLVAMYMYYQSTNLSRAWIMIWWDIHGVLVSGMCVLGTLVEAFRVHKSRTVVQYTGIWSSTTCLQSKIHDMVLIWTSKFKIISFTQKLDAVKGSLVVSPPPSTLHLHNVSMTGPSYKGYYFSLLPC